MLGQRRTVILGAALMAIGHFMMAFEPLFLFALAVADPRQRRVQAQHLGAGRRLYAPGDPRRDRAYSIFYVGINLGAFFCAAGLRHARRGVGWHYGFAAAGVGMMIGLAIYLCSARRSLPPDELDRARPRAAKRPLDRAPNGAPIMALLVLFLPATPVLGDLRAAGQHDRALGRRLHRPHIDLLFWRGEIPSDLVPGVQSRS